MQIVDLIPLDDLAVEFNRADLVVFPEGTSLSALEAAACDTAVLMTNLPPSIEREKNGIGRTYLRGNLENLAQTISSLLEDKEELHKMGRVSGQNVRELYSYEAISEKMLEVAKLN